MCEISPLLFSNVSSNRLIEQMQSHISCMCVVFSNVSFHISSQIACLNRCKVTIVADVRNFSIKFFSNVFSNCLLGQMQSRIGCTCMVFLQSEFSNVSSNGLSEEMHNHIGCICATLQFPLSCFLYKYQKRECS